MSGEAKFEITAQDNVEGMRTHSRRMAGWFALLLSGPCMILAANDIRAKFPLAADNLVLGMLSAILALLAWEFGLRDAFIRRQFRQAKAMHSPARMRWNEEALWIDTDLSQARFEWPQFYRWMASKTSLLLYRDAGFFFVIPRRAVGDQGIDEMVAALKSAGVKER